MKSIGEQALDQLAHAAVGAAILGPIVAFGANPVTLAISAAFIGFIREYTEEETASIHWINFEWAKVFSPRSVLDMLGWTLGGLLLGLFFT